jgi:hypothetical protein
MGILDAKADQQIENNDVTFFVFINIFFNTLLFYAPQKILSFSTSTIILNSAAQPMDNLPPHPHLRKEKEI